MLAIGDEARRVGRLEDRHAFEPAPRDGTCRWAQDGFALGRALVGLVGRQLAVIHDPSDEDVLEIVVGRVDRLAAHLELVVTVVDEDDRARGRSAEPERPVGRLEEDGALDVTTAETIEHRRVDAQRVRAELPDHDKREGEADLRVQIEPTFDGEITVDDEERGRCRRAVQAKRAQDVASGRALAKFKAALVDEHLFELGVQCEALRERKRLVGSSKRVPLDHGQESTQSGRVDARDRLSSSRLLR